tara:strand:+ start:259 stop:588 length:330 start_codon:yes stop_codon:yes gene_type:complete
MPNSRSNSNSPNNNGDSQPNFGKKESDINDYTDPKDWAYEEDSVEDDQLRKLAEEIIRYDDVLTSILSDTISGDVPMGEILRKVCAWQAANGGGYKRASGEKHVEPWYN